MSKPILLSEFVGQLQFPDGADLYFDKQTGAIAPHSGGFVESEKTVGESERYDRLPVIGESEELAIARRFVSSIDDSQNRQRLELALLQTNPLEAFRDAVYRCKIAHEWFPFRDSQFVELAKGWLDSRGIPYVDDVLPA